MMKKALAVLGVIALLGTAAEAQRAGRTARAGRVGGRSGVPSTVNVQGSLTSVSATVADTTATTSVDCTKPAPVTDAQANRVCALAVQQALDVLDKSKRKNATVAYANIELAGKTVSVTDGVTPATCNVEPYCANFIETNVNKMWDTYDAYAQNDQKQCNIMLARMFAAEDCYRYVLTNNTMDGFTAIGGRKVEGCSNADIWSHYQKLDPFETDTTVADDGNIEKYFEKVGGIGLSNLLAYPARIVDLKIDFTTAEFPRELVQLVNSMHNNANAMCGADRFTALYDANFPINYDAKQTSLERQVAEKGLLLGGKQWGVNQIGAVMGTNWADEAMAGKTREEKNKKNLADGDFCHVNVSAETLDYNAIFDELDKSAGSGGFGCFNIDQAGTSNISYMLVTNSTQYTVLKYTSSRGKISGVKIKDTPVDVVYIELESDFVNKK
ncbi:MAG: hypothetical protein LBO78_02355, partial [Rickettsiales bacterium]|nr:hypothetical protein [Rickettsiales bacterium]